MSVINIPYTPTATGLEFHLAATAPARLIIGPVAAGKTVACTLEMLFVAARQAPNEHGVRKTRWGVIRNTYSELKSTTIKTFEEWFGGMCKIVYDSPIRTVINVPWPDGTTIHMEVWFVAINEEGALKKLLSLELTGAYISEVRELPFSLFERLSGRTGRYPKPAADVNGNLLLNEKGVAIQPGATWSGTIMETNPPPVGSWLYKMFEVDRPAGFCVFHQPPALLYNPEYQEGVIGPDAPPRFLANPDAENINNLAKKFDYYFEQAKTASDDYIKVMLMGEYGETFAGKPVWPRFSTATHVARQPLIPNRNLPLIIGFDPGLTPAAAFLQQDSQGRVLLLDEIAPTDITLEDFIIECLSPKVQARFAGMRIQIITDPWGVARSALGKLSTIEMLQKAGYASRPAYTNDIQLRIADVQYFLGRTDGFLIDPRCTMAIKAMSGGYAFAKRRTSTGFDDAFAFKPEKGFFANIADAIGYGVGSIRKANSAPPKRAIPAGRKFLYA